MAQIKLRNNTGRTSIRGALVKLDPKNPRAFVNATMGDDGVIGTVYTPSPTGSLSTINTINTVSYEELLNVPESTGGGITLNQVKADPDIASAISLKHASGSDNQDLSGLQPKETGKGLSANDYTTLEKEKLSGIAANANNYTHPSSHDPSIITQDANNRFVTDAEKTTWNNKGTSNLGLGELSTDAYRGDRGKTAYDHSQTTHAPSNAQANNISDVNAAALTGGGETNLHTHASTGGGLTQAQIRRLC
jgi:hypothetical protein